MSDEKWDEYLKKDDMLFERDENGELLPVDLVVDGLEESHFEDDGTKIIDKPAPKIRFLPISRGKWLRLTQLSDEEQDKILMLEHVVYPKFEEKDLKTLRPTVMGKMIQSITAFTLDIKLGNVKKKASKIEEEALQKNLDVQKEE